MFSHGDDMACLHLASAAGHVEACDVLLAKAGVPALQRDKQGWTALHHAAFRGHSEVCEHLLEAADFDPSDRGPQGSASVESPLSLAAGQRHLPACMVLLHHGANESSVEDKASREWLAAAKSKAAQRNSGSAGHQSSSGEGEKASPRAGEAADANGQRDASESGYSSADVFEDEGDDDSTSEVGGPLVQWWGSGCRGLA